MTNIKQIEHDYKNSNLDLLQAVVALQALGHSEQKAHDLISKWDDDVWKAEPILYLFYLFRRDGDWWFYNDADGPKLSKTFISQFIDDNHPKLMELWMRLPEGEHLRLMIFWDEGEPEVSVRPNFPHQQLFRETLPAPTHTPYYVEDA
jgi:hypothetical protein